MIFKYSPYPPFLPYSSKHQEKVNIMPDILCILATVGFFALMIVFMWACEKI